MRMTARDYGASDVVVHLNGTQLKGVILADEEEGYLIQYSFDEKGNHVVKNGEIETQRRQGIVRLSWPERPELERDLRKQWRME